MCNHVTAGTRRCPDVADGGWDVQRHRSYVWSAGDRTPHFLRGDDEHPQPHIPGIPRGHLHSRQHQVCALLVRLGAGVCSAQKRLVCSLCIALPHGDF
jgi:hypothetical protein